MKKRVALFLAEGCEEIEALTPVDYLRRAEIEVTTLALSQKRVTGGHNITVEADELLSSSHLDIEYDAIVIPGGIPGANHIAENPLAIELIEKSANRGALIAAICAAPAVVLGQKTSLLRNRAFTCYPGFEDKIDLTKNAGATNTGEDSVVEAGNIITARGVGVAGLFSQQIVQFLLGRESAEKMFEATQQTYTRVEARVV